MISYIKFTSIAAVCFVLLNLIVDDYNTTTTP